MAGSESTFRFLWHHHVSIEREDGVSLAATAGWCVSEAWRCVWDWVRPDASRCSSPPPGACKLGAIASPHPRQGNSIELRCCRHHGNAVTTWPHQFRCSSWLARPTRSAKSLWYASQCYTACCSTTRRSCTSNDSRLSIATTPRAALT